MSTEVSLPDLDKLHASVPGGSWGTYSYEGENKAGRHTYSLCSNPSPLDHPEHECLGELYSRKGGTEQEARTLAEYVAALHNAWPTISARLKELEHQVEFVHPWRVRDLETTIQNEHKLYADAHERMLKAEAQVWRLENEQDEYERELLAANKALVERNDLLDQTLRGILQEKVAEAKEMADRAADLSLSGPLNLEPLNRRMEQIAWLESVLGGNQ